MPELLSRPGALPLLSLPFAALSVIAALATGTVRIADQAHTFSVASTVRIGVAGLLMGLFPAMWLRAVSTRPGAHFSVVMAAVAAILAAVLAHWWLSSINIQLPWFPATLWLYRSVRGGLVAVVIMTPVFFVTLTIDMLLLIASQAGSSSLPEIALAALPAAGAMVALVATRALIAFGAGLQRVRAGSG